jgi:Ni/Fe-hydrogenase 1 B-type cytochrome subunit
MTAPTAGTPAGKAPRAYGFGRPLARERGNFTWVYLWGAPLRAMHWIAAACILVLIVTGFYVGRPYATTSGEASAHFLMGRMRFLHFTAAATLVMTGIVRVYWLIAGNRFERFSALFPFTRRNLRNLGRTTGEYLTFRPERAPAYVGHNPLQQLGYTATYVMTLVMVVTGFTLYGQSNPGGVIYSMFSWVAPLFGGLQIVRLVHHALTYAFIIFVIFHVYFGIRADYVERSGVVSSIITGGRYIAANEEYEDYDVEQVPAQPRMPPDHVGLGK